MRLSYKEKPYIMQYAKEKCARSVILLRCSITNIPSKKKLITLYKSEREPKEQIWKLQF